MALDMTGAGTAVLGGIGDVFGGIISNAMAKWREDSSREQNYKYNEMAAENADRRTRALYKDLQSPAALLQQYQEAGLSPSLMFGGSGAGGSVPQGAEGSGASGVNPTSYGIHPLEAAQLQLMQAQARKTNAEADTISGDNERGQAEISNLIQDTATKLAQEGLLNASEALHKQEAAFKKIETDLANETYWTDVAKAEEELKQIQENVKLTTQEVRSAIVKANLDEQTFKDNVQLIKNQVLLLADQHILNNLDANIKKSLKKKIDTEIQEITYGMQLDYWHAQLEKNEFDVNKWYKIASLKLEKAAMLIEHADRNMQIKLQFIATMLTGGMATAAANAAYKSNNPPKQSKK